MPSDNPLPAGPASLPSEKADRSKRSPGATPTVSSVEEATRLLGAAAAEIDRIAERIKDMRYWGRNIVQDAASPRDTAAFASDLEAAVDGCDGRLDNVKALLGEARSAVEPTPGEAHDG